MKLTLLQGSATCQDDPPISSRLPDHLEVQLDLQQKLGRQAKQNAPDRRVHPIGWETTYVHSKKPYLEMYIYIYVLEYEPECQSSPRWQYTF